MGNPRRLVAALAVAGYATPLICGGGSNADAAIVREERGMVDVGVDVSRSVYETKERRLVAMLGLGETGEWGWEKVDGAAGRGGSFGVLVVSSVDSASSGAEKYADVGVTIAGGAGGTWEVWIDRGRWGMLRRRLFLPWAGLGLRLLKLPMGLAKPLPGNDVGYGAGATTATSFAFWIDVRIAAAESRTDGTECSMVSVVFDRGIRCALAGETCSGDAGDSGSMSRSKMALDEECTDVGEDGIEMHVGERTGECARRCCEWRTSAAVDVMWRSSVVVIASTVVLVVVNVKLFDSPFLFTLPLANSPWLCTT